MVEGGGLGRVMGRVRQEMVGVEFGEGLRSSNEERDWAGQSSASSLQLERGERTEDGAAGLDGVLALPDHGDDGAFKRTTSAPVFPKCSDTPKRTASHVLDESREELLLLEVGVVELEVLDGSVDHLESDELVAALLEAGDDLTGESCESVGPGSGRVGEEEGERRTALDAIGPGRQRVSSVLAQGSKKAGNALDHDVGLLGGHD